jgi:hypothetical protein
MPTAAMSALTVVDREELVRGEVEPMFADGRRI